MYLARRSATVGDAGTGAGGRGSGCGVGTTGGAAGRRVMATAATTTEARRIGISTGGIAAWYRMPPLYFADRLDAGYPACMLRA